MNEQFVTIVMCAVGFASALCSVWLRGREARLNEIAFVATQVKMACEQMAIQNCGACEGTCRVEIGAYLGLRVGYVRKCYLCANIIEKP